MTLAEIFDFMPPEALLGAVAVMFVAGFVKGVVGFALPMVAVGGLGAFLPGQAVVAFVIVPTFVTNIWQVLRQGRAAAMETTRRFWRLNLAMCLAIPLSAPLLPLAPSEGLILLLGILVTAAALVQIAGWQPKLPADGGPAWIEWAIGGVAGLLAGLVALWGPHVLLWFMALGLAKTERIRAQGLNFALGATILLPAHILTGVLDTTILLLSLLLTLPVLAGMALGLRLQDRLDQRRFRQATLVVLTVSGLNLLRRALL